MEATCAVVHVAALQQLNACHDMNWDLLKFSCVARTRAQVCICHKPRYIPLHAALKNFKSDAAGCIAWLDSNTKHSFPTITSYACCQQLTLAKNCDFSVGLNFYLCKSTIATNCSKKSNAIFCWLQFLNTTCHRETLLTEDSKCVWHTVPASFWFQALLRVLLDNLEEAKSKVTGLLCQLCKLSLCYTWNFAWRFIV